MSDAARELSRLRWANVTRTDKLCEACNEPIPGGAVPKQRFCSPACRVRADYRRNVEKRKAARRERYRRTQGVQP